MKKYLRWPLFIVLAALVVAALVPAFSLLHSGKTVALAAGPSRGPAIPHPAHHLKPLPHHTTAGVNRTHLPTLTMVEGPVQCARTNHVHPKGALMSGSLNTSGTSTVFFDDFESGAPGWTTVGDNLTTAYYPDGHEFWNLVQNPQTLSVPSAVNPQYVSYPDSAGTLPAAYSGSHAWWYGDNPAVDRQNPGGATMTYMGNERDWYWNYPYEGPGGISTGPNSASLISPSIDLTSVSNATLTFEEWWEVESVDPAHFDMMYVDVSTDGGATWNALGVLNPAQNPAGGSDRYPYTDNGLDTPAAWHIASVDLTPYIGSHIQVRFRFNTVDQNDNGFRGWFIDDVGVYSSDGTVPTISTVTPDNGIVGSTVTITGSGFGAQEGKSFVTFKNIHAPVQSWSNNQIVVTVPAGAVRGGVEVTVNGVKSNNVTFTVNGSLSISTPTAQIGAPLIFTGQGFVSGESVKVYLDGVTGTLLTTATADNSGNITTQSVNVPVVPGGPNLVLAIGQTSSITAGATLSVTPALSTTVTTAQPGQAIILSGEGYGPDEQVSLYLDAGNYLYDANTDNKGQFSYTAYLDNRSISYGDHTIIGQGNSSQLFAQTAPIFITPSVPNPTNAFGGPGTSYEVYGTGFAGNDTIYAYWGTTSGTLLGRGTTSGSNLSLPLTIPTNVSPGNYTITLLSKNTGVATTTSFQVQAPTVQIYPGGVLPGERFTLNLSGFQANEQVALSWNANGGQQISSIQVNQAGAGPYAASVTLPSAPKGKYTVTATGETSRLQTTTSLDVGPGIALSTGFPTLGSTITVMGGGFTPNEQIKVYLQQKTSDVVQTTSDSTGNFSIPFVLPKYSKSSAGLIVATGTAKGENAWAGFQFTPPSFYDETYSDSYGTPITFYGSLFFPGEHINILWNYQQPNQRLIGTATAANDGAFSITLLLPSAPGSFGKANIVNIAAVGQTSKLVGIDNFYAEPGLVITPAQGPAGTNAAIKGGDFGAMETVQIAYQNIVIASATTNQNGFFSTTIQVPKKALIGSATIQVTGESSGYTVNSSFEVLPTITLNPTTGASGTIITVSGTNFTSSGNVYLYWYDPSTSSQLSLGTVTAIGGKFTTTITAPGNLVSGNTYYLQAYDSSTEISTQVAFVAQ